MKSIVSILVNNFTEQFFKMFPKAKILLSIIFSFMISVRLIAGDVMGIVTDQSGKPLPFATLYIMNTTIGTTTNIEGRYSLSLETGSYGLVFQYVGFKRQHISLKIDHRNILLNVALEPEILYLKEVVVTSDSPDPAYAVIREAMTKRKYHLEEVNAFSCKVYIKGLQTLDEKPDKILGMNIPVDTGIVYLSESISELNFERPNKIKEVMISSKVSGSNSAFSYNQGAQMMISYYQNLLTFEGLSERGFVSPIANNAMLFYKYKLAGTFVENGLLINKIQVIPKRKNDPTFSGHIYIIEDSWRIHSIDLKLTKEHQVEFIDELNIYQLYTPVQDDIWMMFSQRFTFRLNIFGFRGDGNFVGIQSDYKIEPNYDIVDSREGEKIDLFSEKYFDNEILKIEDGVNKQTSEYWKEIRPIPLTNIELNDYAIKDSLEVVVNAKSYKDSIDQVVNKFNVETLFLGGYFYQKSFKERYLRFQPIYDFLQFNTVEGTVLNVQTIFTQEKEGIWKYQLTPVMRYGFSSEDFYYKARFAYQFNAKKRTRTYVEGGKFISQLNGNNPISPLVNSYETLVKRRNYMKLIEKIFAKVYYTSEVVNGVTWRGSFEYSRRKKLLNNTDYSFFYNDDRVFTSNDPLLNPELSNTAFGESNALIFEASVRIHFNQKYITRPDYKYNLESEYPTLHLQYRKGIEWLGSEIDFGEISLGVNKDMSYGLFGGGNYFVSGGMFLNSDKMILADYRHFNGNQSFFAKFENGRFQLLDYYQFSTAKSWATAHIDHHFNGFIFNKFPFLRKAKAQVVGSFKYLYSDGSGHYFEYGVGLEHILKIIRLDFYGGVQDGEYYGNGIRLGFGF